MRLFDPPDRDCLDAFIIILLSRAQETLLPEIKEVTGDAGLLRFLDIFGGRTIVVPEKSVIEKAMRDASFYVESTKKGKTYAELGRRHDLDPMTVSDIVSSVSETIRSVEEIPL